MSEEAPVTRTERLLAMLVLHNMAEASQVDKCVMLNRAGFSNPQVADLVGTSAQTVAQRLYDARKASKRPTSATKGPGKKRTVAGKGR